MNAPKMPTFRQRLENPTPVEVQLAALSFQNWQVCLLTGGMVMPTCQFIHIFPGRIQCLIHGTLVKIIYCWHAGIQ